MPWLQRGDDVLAAVDVAVTRRLRAKGLIGQEEIEQVLILRPCRQVHTFGMKVPIDVAFCDRYGFVLHAVTMAPRRVSKPVWRSYFAIEAPRGSFERWKLQLGDVVEIKG
jgi:uncharacterized membrane protein (UPF0127 family)